MKGSSKESEGFTTGYMLLRLTSIQSDAIGTQTQRRILRCLKAIVAALTAVPGPEILCSRESYSENHASLDGQARIGSEHAFWAIRITKPSAAKAQEGS